MAAGKEEVAASKALSEIEDLFSGGRGKGRQQVEPEVIRVG